MGADLEQVDETDASEFHDEKLNAKEVTSSELLRFQNSVDGEVKFIGGCEDLRTPSSQVTIQDLGEVQHGLSGEPDRFHQQQSMNPLRINAVHTEISDILANRHKLLRVIFGHIGHELPQHADLPRW